MRKPASVLFQSAKLGDRDRILAEFAWAEALEHEHPEIERIYGLSGGALVAVAFALRRAAQLDPDTWGRAANALIDFAGFLRQASRRDLRAFNRNPAYGIWNLGPLRHWVAAHLFAYAGRNDVLLSDLGVPVYLGAIDEDGVLTWLGPPDDSAQFAYEHVRIGPPRDAILVDALQAALSTMLSTSPVWLPGRDGRPGQWLRDARPAVVDAGAILADLEAAEPRPILRTRPHAPIRPWKVNWITSSFIMHSQNERNQTLLAAYYLDLVERHRALQVRIRELPSPEERLPGDDCAPAVGHVDLPYIGSTEAFTNMRQSAANKDALMARFRGLLADQLDTFPFDQPANVIYGAGGFSGILGGLVATRAVQARFSSGGGRIAQIYGVSAGVLNGFFHAIEVAANEHADLYTPNARFALADLEAFIAALKAGHIASVNWNPAVFWLGWANLRPLEQFLLDRLSAYTRSRHADQITFDDIGLPLTVTAARGDGFTEFLGMTRPERDMYFGGRTGSVRSAPIVKAIIAGWSMNTYINPAPLNDQLYRDGGGTFYDPGLFVACMDARLVSLLNIHLDEPEGHSYDLPPRPNLIRILFDTHNYVFPEERRRMRRLTDLLYEHYRLRREYARRTGESLPDFRRNWIVD